MHYQQEIDEDEIAAQLLLVGQMESMADGPGPINPDTMTYEQLLELEERMGKVSKGLPEEQIKVILINDTQNRALKK